MSGTAPASERLGLCSAVFPVFGHSRLTPHWQGPDVQRDGANPAVPSMLSSRPVNSSDSTAGEVSCSHRAGFRDSANSTSIMYSRNGCGSRRTLSTSGAKGRHQVEAVLHDQEFTVAQRMPEQEFLHDQPGLGATPGT